MKKNKRIWLPAILLVLILAMSVLFCSCNKTDGPGNGTSSGADESTAEPESTTLDLVKNGEIKIVRVVRSADITAADAPEITAGKKIRDTLNNVIKDKINSNLSYDESITLVEDFLMPGQTYDPSTVEILVGKTAYDESKDAFDGLSYGDYSVKVVGNKIIVASYTTAGYNAAANKLSNLITGAVDEATKSITLNKADIAAEGSSNKSLNAIPMYEGGTFGSYYKAGNSVDEIIIKKTNATEFGAYLDKLASSGYTCYTTKEIKSNKFATYTNDKYTLTAGYYDYETSARIMIEPLADPVPLEAAKYTKVTTSQITMLGLEYKTTDGYASNGLSMVIRLEDGRFIVVDGGFNNAASANNLLAVLREQSKDYIKSPKDINVAAWIITHAHGDHSGMIGKRYETFRSITVEEFLVNFISDSEREKAIAGIPNNWSSGEGGGYSNVITAANALGAKVRTVHVGQDYYYGDAKLEVLYTIESFGPTICNAFNTTSLVIKATIQGTTFMITGDATGNGLQATAKAFGDYLKSDIVQVSHHGYTTWHNDAGTIMAYKFMAPTTLLWPQGGHAYPNYTSKNYNKALTEKSSNPNYEETYVAGWQGDTVIIPLPYKVGSGITNRATGSNVEGASTIKK